MSKRLGKNDRWFLGILAVICIVVCVLFYTIRGNEGAIVEVTIAGEYYGTYSLEEDCRIEIKSNDVITNILEIRNGKADVIRANCPDHLCVYQRAISKNKETIVCLPNQVVIEVQGAKESELDSMT